MSVEKLPLFPLTTVLFPGASLPLHIFEERYRILINGCIEEGGEFGINLVRENEVLRVGCSAAVTSVTQRYDDGKMDVVVTGKRRYQLEQYETGPAPYLVGWVRYLEPPEEPPDRTLTEETVHLYNELMGKVFGERAPTLDPEKIDREVSFVLAQKAGLELTARQRLLEEDSENTRLKILRTHLADILPQVDQMQEVERVIRNDGYV